MVKLSNTHHRTKDGVIKKNPQTVKKWLVVYDAGKPYEARYGNMKELETGLRDFYVRNKESSANLDVMVFYDEKDVTNNPKVVALFEKIGAEE
jgi:hypothetical protein